MRVRIRQHPDGIEIDPACAPVCEGALADFFRLGEKLDAHIAEWRSSGGPEIGAALDDFSGLRVIRQDPVECLFSFLASSAAPIYRIRRCMEGISRHAGERFGDDWSFPSVAALAETTRAEYDAIGFGFRGGNIRAAAAQVLERGGEAWVRGLRDAPYEAAKAELVQLQGVGEKIADCVCLFSLDKDEAVPIDVHMLRAARTLFDGVPASMTPKAYSVIANMYRNRFGTKAGWAQQYLYYAQIAKAGIWDDDLGRHRRGGEA